MGRSRMWFASVFIQILVTLSINALTSDPYIGCYHESIRQRHFSVSPGSYNPDKMTPNYCRERCGTFDYAYAAVAHGKFCFCSKTLPGIQAVANNYCNMTCVALSTASCGGSHHVGVFESITPITGLQVISDVSGVRATPTTVTLTITVASGSRLKYMADFDDNSGFTSYNETDFDTRLLYLPGDYRVQVAANDMDMTFQDTYAVTGFVLEQPVSDVEILCDPAFATHEEGRCDVTVWRGSNLQLDVTFPDRSEFNIRLDRIADPIVSMAGSWIPQPLNTASSGAFLMRYALFTTSGKIYGWRLHVNTPGQIDIMVLSPYCNVMSYCFETNSCQNPGTCLSSNLTDQHMSTHCTNPDIFCMQNEKCHSSCPTPPSRYGTTTINGALVPEYVVKQVIQINPTTVGTQWIDQSPFLDVQAGYIIGINHGYAGRISEVNSSLTDVTVGSSTPSVGQSYFRNNLINTSTTHALQAFYSSGSKLQFKFEFLKDPGVFPMNVTVSNLNLPHSASAKVDINLLEGVDMAIIQGPEFVPSGEIVLFTLANHTGTNLSYFWNITDGSPDTFNSNLSHTFTAPGIYEIGVVIFNSVSEKSNTTKVMVQDKITGLSMTVQDSAVNTGVPFTLSLTTGTNYTCQLDYKGGSSLLTIDPITLPVATPKVFTNTYFATGLYPVIIVCENNVSKENATFDLYIQEPITNLQLVREGAPTNEQFAIGWTVDFGTDINFTLTFNGVTVKLDPTKTSRYSWESVILPGKPASGYPLLLTANNRISSANITTTFIVMDKIVNPTFTVDRTNVTTDDLVTFTINVEKGSDVAVVLLFQDGSPNYTWHTNPPGATWPGPLNLTHYFINGCICNVKAIISNKAGFFERYVDVLVKVGFSTISWSLPDEAFYLYNPPAYVEFMFTSTTNSTPTNPTVTVDWGDGLLPISENRVRFGAPGYRHQFDDTLDYIITVTMSNVLGSRTFKHKAIVVEKLVEPLIDLEYPSAPLGEPFNITFKLYRGDQDNYTTLIWDLADGSGFRVTDRHGAGKYGGDNETVTYSNKGTVTVNVTAIAPLNQTVSASKTFKVIEPVKDSKVSVTATPSVTLGAQTTFTIMYTGPPLPDNPTVVVVDCYGDGSSLISGTLSTSSISLTYTYARDGYHNAKVTVQNDASSVQRVVKAGVYKQFSNLRANLTYPDRSSGGGLVVYRNGLLNQGTVFPLDEPIMFNLQDDGNAYATAYYLNSSGSSPEIIADVYYSNNFEHNFTTIGDYTLEITASNPLYSKTVTKVIQLVKRVKSMSIKEEKPVVAPGQLKNFYFSLAAYGTDACVYLDWNNGVEKTKFGENMTLCNDPNYASAKVGGSIQQLTSQLVGVRYFSEGLYTLKATAKSFYGTDSQEVTFAISRVTCTKPEVDIDYKHTTFNDTLSYTRSSIIRVRGLANIDCPASLTNRKSWLLEHAEASNGSVIGPVNTTGLVTDKAELYLPARSLAVGLYKATYSMVMIDGAETIFNNSAFTYFKVIDSDLVAIMIEGGMTEITRGSQQSLILEPLKWSFDPDLETGSPQGITVSEWTCIITTPNTPSTTCNNVQKTGPSQLILGSNLLINTAYYITAKLVKGTRSAVAALQVSMAGINPPVATIRCVQGSVCLPRTGGFTILETSRVSIECSCPSCTAAAVYQWTVFIDDYRWNQGWRPLQEEDVQERSISSYGLVSKELALEKELFTRYADKTNVFRAQCSIRDVGGNGSAATNMYINKPPQGGYCNIKPLNATATPKADKLWTLTCDQWEDSDGIKEFQFFSVFDEEEVEYEITSYPTYGSQYGTLSFNVSLPIGPSYNSYKQRVKVIVRDIYNAATERVLMDVGVWPPNKAQVRSYISQVLSNPNSNFYKVFQEGDQRSVSELAAAIASSLNQDARDSRNEYSDYEVPSNMICTGYGPYDSVRPNAYKEVNPNRDVGTQYAFDSERNQRSELRTQMVKLALNLSYQDAISIQQVAGLLAQASAEPTEITTDCQNLIIDGLNNMIDILNDRKKMANTPQEDIERAMTNIFSALGSVMEAAGANGNFPTISEMTETQKKPEWKVYDTSIASLGDATDMESARSDDEAIKMHTRYIHKTLFKDKARVFAEQSIAILRKMVLLFNSFAIPGLVQNATSFRMKYRMEKNFVEKFVGRTIKLEKSDVEVKLPNSLQQLFPNQNIKRDDVLTFQVAQTTNYPDRYSKLAEDSIFTYTHFVTLNFFDKDGKALQVNQTLELINVTIPHDSNGPRGVKKAINPLVTQWNKFQLHQTEAKSPGSSIHLKFELAAGTQLLVVAKHDDIPDPAENKTDFIFVVPPTVPPDPKLKDPYTIVISNIDLNQRKGKWWFGTRERFDEDINTPAPTNAEINEKYEKGAGPFKNMYNLTIWTSGCYFLTNGAEDWDDAGCEVSINSTADTTVCMCNHMTTFAGGFVVVPNVIDWNYVFSNADFLSNPTLYLTEIFIGVVFAVAFFLARRKDKRDVTLLGLAPLADNDPRDKYFYEIIVSTGMRRNAGTDSKVYFIMSGEDDESDVRLFSDSKRPIFKRGMTNGFLMATPECLGRINYIRVWHDNSGKGKFGSWFLNYIIVKDLQTDTKQVFIANRWFALEEDDGQIDRIIPLAGKEQMEDFSYQFSERSKKNLADGHLWFSVIARPPGSRFTCVERVACCLCLLFMTMLTNAMFYNTDGNTTTTSSTSFTFGPFSLSVSQIFIGFISTVIVFPVNFLLVFLFRKAQPRQKRPSRVRLAFTNERPGTAKLSQVKPQMDSEHTRSTTSLATTASYPDGRSDNEHLVPGSSRGASSPSPSEAETMALTGKKKKSYQLPWWCKWVAWVLLILCTLMSAALVTFYGISFKDETCKKWITSLIISFFTSVFITQPIKVILTAIFLSLVIKNPGEEEDDEENDEETYPINKEDSFLHTDMQGSFAAARPKKVGYKPPNPKELARLREIRLNEVKMWAVIREILFYSMFLWVLLIISHRNRGPDNFNYKNNMVRTFITNQNLDPKLVTFLDIKNRDDFWQWLQNGFMTGIMANAYYNDYPPLRLRTYINDKSSRILGHATLRQLRIKPDKCTVPDIVETMIKECNVGYSIEDQEERDFSVGWVRLNESQRDTNTKTEYMWSTEDSLNSYPYWGILAIYSGGGYVAHLNGTRDEVNETLYRLQDEQWIDKYTRAVFIEFTVYNPQVNLFSVNMILAEFNIANGIIPSYRFEPAMLLPYMDGAMIFQIVCEVLFVAYIIGFIVIEFLQFLKQRSAYFTQFWNWIEISIISISITAIVIYFYRLHEANKLTKQFKASSGNDYIKFQYVGYWNEIFAYLIGFIVFLATIKYLRLLRFNRRISMLADTLKHSGKHLFHFSIIFWIIFFAFCQLFFLTFRFGDDSHASIDRSAISLILMLMGKFSIYSMSMVDPVLSQIYILVYVIALSFIILNMFISILTDTFSAVREDLQKQNNDYEIIDFMLGRLKKWTGLGVIPSTTIDPNANRSLEGYANDGYVNDDENSELNDENEDKDRDQLNPNMAMFPSRIDRLLHSLSAIYRENDNSAMASMPWGKQPYQAPPRATRMERPGSNLQKRRSSLAKVDTA